MCPIDPVCSAGQLFAAGAPISAIYFQTTSDVSLSQPVSLVPPFATTVPRI